MGFEKELQIGDVESVEKVLHRIFVEKKVNNTNFLDVLLSQRYTWHCGGMSDPFQPIEQKYHITKQLVDLSNKYGITILFSTKSDTIYDCAVNPRLHSFQLSVSNTENRKDIEPNVPDIENRYKFYRSLKDKGFKVGIRIQPFIPKVTNIEILDMFHDADHFTIEGIKLVPQNEEQKKKICDITGVWQGNMTQMGLLNLLPEKRLNLYKPFIEKLEDMKASYSIADNDLHHLGNNYCCCGDRLAYSTSINTTYMCHYYGKEYAKEQIDEELFNSNLRDCKCNHLFSSNRQEDGAVSVQDFFDRRFYRETSPFSPLFLYDDDQPIFEQISLFD
jgi:DNA repair photolyase